GENLHGFGFGQVTGSGFPGESAGLLNHYSHWRRIGTASLSFGYGVSVTSLQLAQAYAILGSGGIRRPVSLRRVDEPVVGERVLDPRVAAEMLRLMGGVVSAAGTGQ